MVVVQPPLVDRQRQVRDMTEGLVLMKMGQVAVEVDQPLWGQTEQRVLPVGLEQRPMEALELLIVSTVVLSTMPLVALVVTDGIPPLTAPAHPLRMEQDGLTLIIEDTVVLVTLQPITRLDHLVL
jgi:hypothetical protein